MPALPRPKRSVYSERARTREEAAAGLRLMADLLEAHPEIPVPSFLEFSLYVHPSSYGPDAPDDARERTAAALRALPGTYTRHEPEPGDLSMTWQGELAGVLVSLRTARAAVCEKVVVGTETVHHPARGAITLPAITTAYVEVVEVVEWRCAPVLGGEPDNDDATADRQARGEAAAAEVSA